jgi:hypothetical protein
VSVDLAGIRAKIAEVLLTIPTFNKVDQYELLSRTDADMPLVNVWRDTASEPDVNQPQPDFQSFGFSFDWHLRCYIPLSQDEASQVLCDSLTLDLFDAFNDPGNALAVSGLVDEWRLESVQPTPDVFANIPVILLLGLLRTQASG